MKDNENRGQSDSRMPPLPEYPGEDQFKWFEERRRMLAQGVIPEKSAQEEMDAAKGKKPLVDDRIPVGKQKSASAQRQRPQKKKADIKPFIRRDKTDRQASRKAPDEHEEQRVRRQGGEVQRKQQAQRSAQRERNNRTASREQSRDSSAQKLLNERRKAKQEKLEKQFAGMSNDERRRALARNKKLKKRRSIFIGCVLAVSVVSAIAVGLCLTVLFGVENVLVEGETRYTADEIIAVCGIVEGENLLMIDKEAINDAVYENLAYVGGVVVSRKFPDTVVLNVTDTNACYAIPNSENYILTDENGKVLSRIEREIPNGVCELRGFGFATAEVGKIIEPTEQSAGALNTANSLYATAENCKISSITCISVENSNALYLIYEGRIKIHVGTAAKAEKKLSLAKGIIDKLNSESATHTGVLNVSVTGKAYFNSGSVDAEASTAKGLEISKTLETPKTTE